MRDELIVIIMYRSSKRKQYFDYSNYIIWYAKDVHPSKYFLSWNLNMRFNIYSE
jgi:hypothetical protein